MIECHLAIVGGGPAASAAAICAADAGLRVILVERTPAPRARPGEALHPGAETLFRQLGVEQAVERAGFLRHRGIRVTSPETCRFEPFGEDASGPWLGYQADRAQLDGILLSRAQSVGAELWRPAAVESLNRTAEGWLLQTTRGSVASRMLLDASGAEHWLAGRAHLPISRVSPRLIARYAYYPAPADAPVEPEFRMLAGGWNWTAAVRPGVMQWIGLSLDGDVQPLFPPPQVANGQIRAADVTWRVMPACAGPGYFVAGDAAAVLDPAVSHGVLRALMSGIQAAQLTVGIIRHNLPEDEASHRYRSWLLDWFRRDVAELSGRYRRFPHPPDWGDRAPAAAALVCSAPPARQETIPAFARSSSTT